ncbi:WXG100 family type VII secretion target [Nocardia puris]|uniref:WXG100 family type VII secretion target n=1 Tax=Nocardia puris TaxID=208602 RepID=A0A366D707_9NOCA|nr:WXG100 family type VII secretion target [Nocardia puris]RBO85269.1 WXG100 family type VII secretion target [Nocardia puris]
MTARSYDLAAMQRFIDVLDKQIDAISGERDAVKRTAEALLLGFSGAAATSFDTAHQGWQSGTGPLIEQLRALRDRVSTALENYIKAEEANRSMTGR